MNALVLGVDGVLFASSSRGRALLRRRSVEYVRRKTGEPVDNARLLEAHARDLSGHAAVGLRAMYPSAAVSVREYSAFVYDAAAIEEVLEEAGDAALARDADRAARAFDAADDAGAPVYLFTDAPAAYVRAVLDRLGLGGRIDPSRVFACDAVDTPLDLVKPTPLAFVAADFAIRTRHGRDAAILFVDDSLSTVVAATQAPGVRWMSAHFDPSKHSLLRCLDVLGRRPSRSQPSVSSRR